MPKLKSNIINIINWNTGWKHDDTVKAVFYEGKFKDRIRKMVENGEPGFEIINVGDDGSIMCEFPLSALHITPRRSKKGSSKKEG